MARPSQVLIIYLEQDHEGDPAGVVAAVSWFISAAVRFHENRSMSSAKYSAVSALNARA